MSKRPFRSGVSLLSNPLWFRLVRLREETIVLTVIASVSEAISKPCNINGYKRLPRRGVYPERSRRAPRNDSTKRLTNRRSVSADYVKL